MILIISDINDVHTLKVESILDENNVKYFRLNLDVESLKSTIVQYSGAHWLIKSNNGQFNTNEITVVWNRRIYVELMLDEVNIDDPGFKIWKGEWNKTLLGIYSALEDRKWLNYYRDSYYAENKYRQYTIAKEVGFKIPELICSNDKNFILNCFQDGEERVLKFMSQEFYKIEDGLYKGIYVNKVRSEDFNKFQDYGENPIIIQNYVAKKFEVRYTVVGGEHFVCKIDSQSSKIANVDWRRYDLPNTPHSIIYPPVEIKEKITNFMRKLKLNYGAFDFIVSENDEWFFLELNSMGQFLWIEDLTGLEISKSIANWLINNN